MSDLKVTLEQMRAVMEEQRRPRGLPTLYGVARGALESHHIYHHGPLRECKKQECKDGVAVLEKYEKDPTYFEMHWRKLDNEPDLWVAKCNTTEIYAKEEDRLKAESDHFVRHHDCALRPIG